MKELRNPHPFIYIGEASDRFLSNRNNLYPTLVVAASLIIESYSEALNLNEKTVLAIEGVFLLSAVWSFVRLGLHIRSEVRRLTSHSNKKIYFSNYR